MREYKLAILGAGGVGKSALTARYINGCFYDAYDPTIEDSYRKDAVIDGRNVTLEILDTAGIEQFRAMRELYIRNSDGFVLAYDVMDPTSLEELEALHTQICGLKDSSSVPIILVGTKSDLLLPSDLHGPGAIEQARSVVRDWRIPHVVTSAKTGDKVDAVFEVLVRTMARRDSAVGSSIHNHSMSSGSLSFDTSSADQRSFKRSTNGPRTFASNANLGLKKSMVRLRHTKSVQKLTSIASMASLRPHKQRVDPDPEPEEILPPSFEEDALPGVDIDATPEIPTVYSAPVPKKRNHHHHFCVVQ